MSDRAEIELVLDLRDNRDLTFAKIAEIMGFSESTAKRRYRAGKVVNDEGDGETSQEVEVLDAFPEHESLPDIPYHLYLAEDRGPIERFRPFEVVDNNVIVASDFHIPLHDPMFINVMISAARCNDIKTLIINGDYFNMDSFSSFLPYQPEAALEQEKLDGQTIMRTFLQTFDHVYMTWGNHDFRLVRKLGFKHSFEECVRYMLDGLTQEEHDRIHITNLDYLHYYNSKSKWHVCHPRNFSSAPLTVPRKLALRYGCNVITGHSHHAAIGAAMDGIHTCIESGGFYDVARTEYIQKSATYHEWTQGFVMFNEAIPQLISPVIGNDRIYR